MGYLIKDVEGNPLEKDGQKVVGVDISNVVKGIDFDKRTLSIIGTDQTADRDGDIIVVNGWDFENYAKNPVFLWAHNYSSVPLASAIKIAKKRSPWRVELTHRFPPEGINPFADMIFQLYMEKVINAGSVGFIPKRWEDIKQDDPVPGTQHHWYPRKYLEQELLEHSGVAVPANPNAIQNALKGMGVCDAVKNVMLTSICESKSFPHDDEAKERILNELKEFQLELSIEEDTNVQVQVPGDIVPEVKEEDAKGEEDTDVEDQPEEKKIGGSKTLPTDDKSSWNAAAAIKRMRVHSGGPDKEDMDWKKYRRGFVWYDSEDEENFGSYKLPFADVLDGSLKATWGGVSNAMRAVLGARGGVDIGDEKEAAYDFLAKYYDKFDKPVPDYKFIESEEEFEGMQLDNVITIDEIRELDDELATGIVDLIGRGLIALPEDNEVDITFSKGSIERLNKVVDLIQEVLAEIEEDETESPAESETQTSVSDIGPDVIETILDSESADDVDKIEEPEKSHTLENNDSLTALTREVSGLVGKVQRLKNAYESKQK